MLPIEDYALNHKIARRTVERKIALGELFSVIRNGRTYIIEKDELKEQPESIRKEIKKLAEITLDKMIIRASKGLLKDETDNGIDWGDKADAIKKIHKIALQYEYAGLTLKSGYSLKSLYRKINNPNAIERKPRADKHVIKNEILKNGAMDKLRYLASLVFTKHAKKNISQICKLVLYYAKQEEAYSELNQVPFVTLYRSLNKDFTNSGFKSLHQYLNHYNKFYGNMPVVQGVFTDNIKFMDHFIIDDHKADVFKVKVYNKRTGKDEEKQVQIWSCIEAKTMKVLSVMLKAESFTAEDLILLIAKAFAQYGMPRISIMADNGLARSERFQQFIDRIWLRTKHPLQIDYSKAYTPTNKATIELMHGLWKNEFDSYFNNFVSPDKINDSRHTDLSLTPAMSDFYFQEYQEKFLNYLDTYYQKIDRTRVIDGIRQQISIEKYFNEQWTNYIKKDISNRDLRYAMGIERITKLKMSGIKLFGDIYLPMDAISLPLLDHPVKIFYNPNNLNEIDVYAIESIIDGIENKTYHKGDLIVTLYNQRANVNKYEDVAKLRKQYLKSAKNLAKYLTDLQEANKDEMNKLLPTNLPPNKDEIEKRNNAEEQVRISIQELKLKTLYETPKELEEEKTEIEEDFKLEFDEDEYQKELEKYNAKKVKQLQKLNKR